MSGPLTGIRVIEMEAIGPVPWAGMMLADMGADVLRIDRPTPSDTGVQRDARFELTSRGKRVLVADLKTESDRASVLSEIQHSQILLEGLRPGVMERLKLGPDVCLARNPQLVYGRMTGWGQSGPLADAVGHDINYIATAGALHTIGAADTAPSPPINFVGDYGGGAMLLLAGVLAALYESKNSGKGQVVDAAMVDGTLLMMAPILGRWQAGEWQDQRESNILDGGAHFYTSYTTSDGQAVAVGAIEPRFYAALLAGLQLDPATLPHQHDSKSWPALRTRFAAIFAQQTRAHWEKVFTGTEACVSPVLQLSELQSHPHLNARHSLTRVEGLLHPAPAPRFSRTPSAIGGPPVESQR